eukprot:s350_g14.t2
MQTIELSSDQLRAMAETTAAIASLNHRAAGMRKSQHLPVKFCSPLSSLLFLLDATSRGLKLSSPVRVKEASVLLALLFISESVYWAKEETELNILNGRFKYDARKWKGVSKSSFDFVSKLLQRDPDQRMTAEQALAHPWIAEREQFPSGTESAGLDASVVHSLAEYSRASKFRRTCMQVMAWSLNNAEMAEVREAFMELDVQKTGAIQLHQLKSVLEERFNICDEETRKIFEALDSSNNEEVGYSEFLAAMMSSRIQVHEDLVRAAFQRYDEDDSGYISVENLRQVLTESLDSPETAEEMLSGVSVFAGAEQRVSFDAFIEYLTGGEADESHKRAVGFVIDKQMSRMSSSELMRVAPTLRHCPLTPKGLNRAKSTPFMMVEDSSDDEAKKEIPMSPFLTTPNPVKQTKVPSLVDTTEAAANAKQLEEVPESPPPTVPTPAVKGEVKSSAVLDCKPAGESYFSIVESNHFRELTHIALKLRQGSDEVVKKHLAHKLRAARAEAASLSQRLATSSEALTQSQAKVNELTARARVVADERAHLEESLQVTHQRELRELKDEHARALTELQCSSTAERARMESEHKQALRAALDRAQSAEGSVEELQRTRQSLTVTGESCRERLEVAERQLMEASQETGELRKQLKQLEELKFRHERDLNGLQVQLASVKEQLAVREQHTASQAAQIEEAVRERRMLEESLATVKKQAAMAHSMQLQAIEGRLQKALERVRLVLSTEKTPQLAANVHHQYNDKYFLAASQLNCLSALGLTADQLHGLRAWLPAQVSLRFRSQEKCTFLREEKREEEDPRKRVEEVSVGGVARASWSSKVVTTITEYFWKFETSYTLEAFRGVGAEDADRLLLLSRNGQVELKTSAKSPPPHPEARVPAVNQEVNITWLLQLLIDRAATGCSTPRRNQDVDKAFAHFTMFTQWANGVSDYLQHLSAVDPRTAPQLPLEGVFAPILPLMVSGQTSSSSPAEPAGTLATLNLAGDVPDSLVLSVSDGNRLLSEDRGFGADTARTDLQEMRTIKEQQENICESLPGNDGIYTRVECGLHLILRHCENVAKRWSELVEYVEGMLRKQLIDAIGKEVTPALFAAYMRFHYRKLFRQAFQPRQFCFAVRRSERHSPEGTDRDHCQLRQCAVHNELPAECIDGGLLHWRRLSSWMAVSPILRSHISRDKYEDPLSASASGAALYLTSRARQFSSMLVLVGRVASATSFDPKFAAILQNKDELTIPLELSMIPTPKEFKDAIASLSPQQQAFAKAFRSMQLESTLFGVLVVQIKPQLEKLLNLPDDSLTKEIKLTQDLMDLFIKYQIPSDLLSFSDETGDAEVAPAQRLEMVKGHVKAMHDMIQQEKEAELLAARQEMEYAGAPQLRSQITADSDS